MALSGSSLVVAKPALAGPNGIVERPEGLILDIVFRGRDEEDDADPDADFVPIPVEDRVYYCDMVQEAARAMWEMTNGHHYVWRPSWPLPLRPAAPPHSWS